MSTFQWKELLTQWSKDIIESGEFDEQLSPEVVASNWLGFDEATEVQIVQAELRLNTKLPRSYREFLKVSNGWRMTTPFIWSLWSVEKIEWLPTRNADLVDAWGGAEHEISDEEYFIYGEEQDCIHIRGEYFSTALEISE